jgi:methylated-DNA-[protein]-cysteine S-methyltransferase
MTITESAHGTPLASPSERVGRQPVQRRVARRLAPEVALDALACDTPLGRLWLAASAHGLAGAWFDGQRHFAGPQPQWRDGAHDALLREAAAQLAAYFAGNLRAFDLPLAPHGTPFQRRVWQAIAQVPYAARISYAALARAAGVPAGVRAAGAATGRNPLSIIVPCHRIVGAHGALTGYAGGLERKRALLALEAGAHVLASRPACAMEAGRD